MSNTRRVRAQLEETWPRETQPRPTAAVPLCPSCTELFLPTEHSERSPSVQSHTGAHGPLPGPRLRGQQEDDASVATAATLGPWKSDESLSSTIRHPPSSCDHGGSWCDSVETPITSVRLARQVWNMEERLNWIRYSTSLICTVLAVRNIAN